MWISHGEAVRGLQFADRQPSNVTVSVSHTQRSADNKKQVLSIRAEQVRRACAYAAETILATHKRTRYVLKLFADGSQPTLLGVL